MSLASVPGGNETKQEFLSRIVHWPRAPVLAGHQVPANPKGVGSESHAGFMEKVTQNRFLVWPRVECSSRLCNGV